MLNQNAVLDAQDVGCNPIHREAECAESPVHNYNIALGNDESGFVLQGRRCVLYQIEQSIPSWLDVSAVLDVLRRPKRLSGRVVALVKQCVKRLEHEVLVLLLNGLFHVGSPFENLKSAS